MLPQAQAVQAQAVQQNDTVPRAVHEEALQRLQQTEDQLQQTEDQLQQTEDQLRQQRMENNALRVSLSLPGMFSLYVKITCYYMLDYISFRNCFGRVF